MITRNFREMLEAKWAEGKFVCVGLDSDFGKIPESARRSGNECDISIANSIVAFNQAIVEATKDLVCAYKPNAAFYEAYGDEGLAALSRTIVDIHALAPDVPVILDAKRADIGSTNAGYVRNAFEFLDVDAITLHPYLGAEALQPFLERADKGIIVLCRTSNPGAGEFQDQRVFLGRDKLEELLKGYDHKFGSRWHIAPDEYVIPFYEYVAIRVARHWNTNGNCGLVVGATYPEELREVREIVGDMPILIPGVGFQQKDVPLEEQVRQVVDSGKDSRGRGMIINSSRGIIFASKGPDFAEAARRETLKLHQAINDALQKE